MTDKLQLNRAGLLNFWYYDNEVLDFTDGKLLLRGSNGSGKSVTMQSLITILLDGKKSPDRLDPFGSRARKMEDYLLGESAVNKLDERTGYLWLEYKRENSDRYITTGIGLRARRNSTMDFWGFAITDNRRIGKDINLHRKEYSPEEGKEVLAPLTRKELTNRIEPGGRVVRSQREYMELVNRYVFGFESTEAYEDLIKLLIQLRSPKLSKDFKPTVIYEILNESIPPLSDEELRPLSETIENMDQIKQQLEQLERDRSSLKKLSIAYDAYNRYMLAEKAAGLLKAASRQDNQSKEKSILETSLAKKQDQLSVDQQLIEDLAQEQKVLEQERRELEDHDVFRAQEQLSKTKEELNLANETRDKKGQELDGKQRRERGLTAEAKKQGDRIYDLQTQVESCLVDMEEKAENASFNAHQEACQDFLRPSQDYDFSLWKDEVRDYSEQLAKIQSAARKYANALERHQHAEDEHGTVSKQVDELVRSRNKLEEEQDSLKEQWLEDFHQWEVSTQELHLTPEEKQLTAHRLMDIFELHKPNALKQPLRQAHDRNSKNISTEIAKIAGEMQAKNIQLKETQAQIQEWRQMQEPEPQRHPDTSETRAALKKARIPHMPLYGAVEFMPHVTEEERERLESAITQAGLLDALIVPNSHLTAVQGWDKIILPNPRLMEHTLADVLEPVAGLGVDAQTIDNALRSILMNTNSIEPGGITLDTQGNYRIALISGQAPREKAKFIGKEARRRFRLNKIAELENLLTQHQDQLDLLNSQHQQLQDRLAVLNQELEDLPTLMPLEDNWDQIKEVDGSLKLTKSEAAIKRARVDETYSAMQAARHQLQILARELNLPESEEAYAEAIQEMNYYTSLLRDLEGYHQGICHCRELISKQVAELEDVQTDVDTLKGEINVIDSTIRQLTFSIQQIKVRLQELGAQEITARIEAVISRLEEIPKVDKQAYERTVNLRRDIEDGKLDLERLAQQLELSQSVLICWQGYFTQELNFRFVLKQSQEPEQEEPGKQHQELKELLSLARQVAKDYSNALNTDRERITARLSKAFFEEGQYLVEYRPDQTEHSLTGDLPSMGEDWADYLLSPLTQARHRQIIMLDYDGQKKDIYLVLGKMEQDIEIQQQLLSEKDRELYEEIILHSVGEIIRKRINRAQNWVEEINKLMEQRDTSSGLTFSLRWKPRAAEQEEELDTEELVDLLRRDPNLLKEEDMLQISRHFKSKIDRAKAELADTEKGETFHSIVAELLDYRNWFKFMLLFRKGKEQKRELTNNMFFTFSGGEKAMAMYIPLFSAAYSRYQDAKPDAPRIISLDEAFAGVDETNIRDMFDLMENLGFNYIINSQSLWGDYDTANKLAICELVRPKNAPWVTVIRYLWDGKTKHLLNNREVAATTP